METKFNFNSAICTSRSQSEKLLALGLKKETADMVHTYLNQWDGYHIHEHDWSDIDCDSQHIPAWSLGRLIEMRLAHDSFVVFQLSQTEDAFEKVISHIEHAIKEGYFNKEYLV